MQEMQERPCGATVRTKNGKQSVQARRDKPSTATENGAPDKRAMVGRLSKKRQGRKGWARQ